MREQSKEKYTKHDREVSREIHRLFWRARMQSKKDVVIWVFTRPPAIFINAILVPLVVAYSIQAIFVNDFDTVQQNALVLLLFAILFCILWGIGGVFICNNGRIGTEYIQKEVFKNYLEKDYEFFNNTYVGSLGSQAVQLRHAFNEYESIIFNGVVRLFIIFTFSIGVIAYQSIPLAAVTLLLISTVLLFTILSSRWRLKYRRTLGMADSDTSGVIADALSHGVTVKSFAAEQFEKERLSKSVSKLATAQYWSWMTSIPVDIGRVFLMITTTAILLLMTSYMYKNGAISIAIVVLVQLYVLRIINATYDISELVKTYEAVMVKAHQPVKTMMIKPNVYDREKTHKLAKNTKHDVHFNNVNFCYSDAPKNVYAVKNFNLDIKQGEKVGLIGYSGSGKTTLTKLLLRFTDINEGAITIDGVDIRDVSQSDLRFRVAYVPQEPLLFHRSIRENISYGDPTASRQKVEDAAKAAYVNEFVQDLNKGYDTRVGEKGIKLSGGQRQRVAIARALLKNAPILVLDEATSALDSKSEQYIQKALWKLMEGRTAIVIAHRLSTIQRMDRIVVMDKGKIIDIGTHDELLKRDGIYAKLWAHQSGGYIGAPSE